MPFYLAKQIKDNEDKNLPYKKKCFILDRL